LRECGQRERKKQDKRSKEKLEEKEIHAFEKYVEEMKMCRRKKRKKGTLPSLRWLHSYPKPF
jgi:hypothetical protein